MPETPVAETKAKRAPNFLPEEDEQLAKSWLIISQDPVKSNQQGKDNFFNRIASNFNEYTPGPQRDSNGLQCRYVSHQLYASDFIIYLHF